MKSKNPRPVNDSKLLELVKERDQLRKLLDAYENPDNSDNHNSIDANSDSLCNLMIFRNNSKNPLNKGYYLRKIIDLTRTKGNFFSYVRAGLYMQREGLEIWRDALLEEYCNKNPLKGNIFLRPLLF